VLTEVEAEEWTKVVKGERTNFAPHSRTDPKDHIGQVISMRVSIEFDLDLDGVQVGALIVPPEKIAHELPEVSGRPWAVATDEAQARGGPPEVAPAPGEHARLHGFLRWEEGEDVLEHFVGEGAEVGAARSLEQATGVIGAARQETIKRRDGGQDLMGGRAGYPAAAPPSSPHLAAGEPLATTTGTEG
jgi:hypothetical protein